MSVQIRSKASKHGHVKGPISPNSNVRLIRFLPDLALMARAVGIAALRAKGSSDMRKPSHAVPSLVAALALTAALSLASASIAAAQNAEPAPVKIGLMRLTAPRTIPISLLDRPASDDSLAGAKLAIDDNNTTGAFTKQKFELEDAAVSDPQQATDALGKFNAEGIRFVVTTLPADLLLPVADAAAQDGILVFNAGATDDSLRGEDCRANVIHVVPSRAMLADALGQYLVWKKWTRWFLIVGSHEADQAVRGGDQARGAALRR